MATSNDLLIKQRSVIEFLAAEGCSAANIHARMKTVESSKRPSRPAWSERSKQRAVKRVLDNLPDDNARRELAVHKVLRTIGSVTNPAPASAQLETVPEDVEPEPVSVISKLERAVKSRRVVIQNATDFFAFCKTHLVKPDQVDGKCSHYRRNFILVRSEEIQRKAKDELYPVKGTRAFHSIKSIGELELKVRPLTCFCHGCETGTMNCDNDSHVELWKVVKIKIKRHALVDDSSVPTIEQNLRVQSNFASPTPNSSNGVPSSASIVMEPFSQHVNQETPSSKDGTSSLVYQGQEDNNHPAEDLEGSQVMEDDADVQRFLENLVQEACEEVTDSSRNLFADIMNL
ncbi:hypothetical protein PoB_002698600 [Plakobranchus ocellatus]|uniref:Uncharacterized protein n=1 Tax=Plakobranchus ocellatus TaxID=259542 RepID=A0AAV4A150_9GAST|nr:hypothetical protein PoB_002698600 [Plakobranchus ocellatus]